MLNRPGALPKLLSIIANSNSTLGAGDALPLTLQGSLMMARMPTALSFDDMSAILQRVCPLSCLSDMSVILQRVCTLSCLSDMSAILQRVRIFSFLSDTSAILQRVCTLTW